MPALEVAHMTAPDNDLSSLMREKLELELRELRKPPPSFWRKLLDEWKAAATAVLLAFVAVFPNHLVEQFKDALNRADQRLVQFRQLSEDLGEHIFSAELWLEYYENGWTTKEGLTPIVADYNRTITTLRKREQLYRAVIARYWDDSKVADYDTLLRIAKDLDSAIHELNPEAELVANGKEPKARPEVVAPVLSKVRPLVQKLSPATTDFLKSLIK